MSEAKSVKKLEAKILKVCLEQFVKKSKKTGKTILEETSEGIKELSEYTKPEKEGKKGALQGTYSRENVNRDQLIATQQGLIRRGEKKMEKILKIATYGLASIGRGNGSNTTNIWNRLFEIAMEDCTLASLTALIKVFAFWKDCHDIKSHHSAAHMCVSALVLSDEKKCRITDCAANPKEDYTEIVDLEFCSDMMKKLRSLKHQLDKADSKSEIKKIEKKIEKLEEEIDEFEADDADVAKALFKAMKEGDLDNTVKYIYYLHHHDVLEKGVLSADFIPKVIKKYLKKNGSDISREYCSKIYEVIYEIKSWHRGSKKVEVEGEKKKKSAVSSADKSLLLHMHMAFMILSGGFEKLEQDPELAKAGTLSKYMKTVAKNAKDELKECAAEYSLYKKDRLIKKMYKDENQKRKALEKTSTRELVSLRRKVYDELDQAYEQGSESVDEEVEAKMQELMEKEREITHELSEVEKPGIPVWCIDKHTAEGGRKFSKLADKIYSKYFPKETKKVHTRIAKTLGEIHFVNVKAHLENTDEECEKLEKEWFLKSKFSAFKL